MLLDVLGLEHQGAKRVWNAGFGVQGSGLGVKGLGQGASLHLSVGLSSLLLDYSQA